MAHRTLYMVRPGRTIARKGGAVYASGGEEVWDDDPNVDLTGQMGAISHVVRTEPVQDAAPTAPTGDPPAQATDPYPPTPEPTPATTGGDAAPEPAPTDDAGGPLPTARAMSEEETAMFLACATGAEATESDAKAVKRCSAESTTGLCTLPFGHVKDHAYPADGADPTPPVVDTGTAAPFIPPQ